MKEDEKIELKPGERCPYCGQMKRGNYQMNPKTSEARKQSSRKNGKKGGRPPKNAE